MSNSITEKELVLLVKETVGLGDNLVVTLLAGDASTRKYYRARDERRSFIIVVSEPYPSDDPSITSNYAFSKLSAPVPTIIKAFPDKGIMIKEDLGGIHLQNIKDPNKLTPYYDKAVEIMLAYQLNGASFTEYLYPLSYSFTKDKFMSELKMTTEYYIKAYKQKALKGPEQKELEAVYEELVNEMMMQKKLLLHRDYHSRNLMVKEGSLYVIDYQDSRLGPYSYDVASLVIDPYIVMDKELRDRVITGYYCGIKAYVKDTYIEFKRNYHLCFLQRGIKILGTFAYQKVERNNDRYLEYIHPSENKIKDVLKAFPEWKDVLLGTLLK
jgi:aminoglycoside/choline kinase family phosphotransferase